MPSHAIQTHRLSAFALQPPTTPSLYELAKVGELINSVTGDVTDLAALETKVSTLETKVAALEAKLVYLTTEGKEKSRCNAVRHGLTAETVIGALEDAEDYKAFEAAVIADYDALSMVLS